MQHCALASCVDNCIANAAASMNIAMGMQRRQQGGRALGDCSPKKKQKLVNALRFMRKKLQ